MKAEHNAETHDLQRLDASFTVSQVELGRMCGLSVAEVDELVDYGLLVPQSTAPTRRVFSAACVQPLREAAALRTRFDLDLFVLGLLFSQLEHLDRLERQVRALQAHLPQTLPEREGPASWREPHGFGPE